MKGKAKEAPPPPPSGFSTTPHCTLPVWDDSQVAQEDWGAPLAAAPLNRDGRSSVSATLNALGAAGGAGNGGKETSKMTKAGKDAGQGGAGGSGGAADTGFVDEEGRAVLRQFVENGVKRANDETGGDAGPPKEAGVQNAADSAQAPEQSLSPEKHRATPPECPVRWQRPADIVKPFRPVVHRNTTPFLDPYNGGESPSPFDAKLEEARFHVEATSSVGATAAGGSGNATHRASTINGGKAHNQGSNAQANRGSGSTDAKQGAGPWHQLYPETISLLKDLVGQDTSSWAGMSSEEAVTRYRELPALMEPYNPDLVAGCARTPAEACQSRYSTALRHKLEQADALAALDTVPPFLMRAFNSAVLLVEQAQHLVKPGSYLWELIYPHAPGTCHPVYNPHGKYAVKLFVDGAYRKIMVDDAIPVDSLGRPLLSVTSLKELWPALLAKAVMKALGPTLTHKTMTLDPETIVGFLIGDCGPQHVKPKRSLVATAALLLTYQRQLDAQRSRMHKAVSARDGAGDAPAPSTAEAPSPDTAGDPAVAHASKHAGSDTDRAGPTGRPSGSRAGSAKNRARATSATRKPKPKEVPEEKDALPRLFAEEYCPPSDDEPVEKRPLLLCGLRNCRQASLRVNGFQQRAQNDPVDSTCAQLFAITDIANFRNTLAIRLATTPKTDLVPGVFDRERDAEDVQGILSRPACFFAQHTLASSEKANSVTSLWVTFEEFTELMDSAIAWHLLSKRYLHAVELDTTNTAVVQLDSVTGAPLPNASFAPPTNANATSGGKGSARAKAADAAATSLANAAAVTPPSTMHVVAWLSMASDSPEEITVVIKGFMPTPSGNDKVAEIENGQPSPDPKAVSGAAEKPTKKAAGRDASPAPSDGTKGAAKGEKSGKKKDNAQSGKSEGEGAGATTEADGLAALPQMEGALLTADMLASPKTFATPTNGGNRTPPNGPRGAAAANSDSNEQKRRLLFEYFAWDRADPLSHAFDVPYESGKTTSHLFRLRPGAHVYKVTIPHMYNEDQITFHCNARMMVRGSLPDLLKAQQEDSASLFHMISDAGVHPGVESAENEMIWFKRCLMVKSETKLTMTLSTLLPTEDLAIHRFAAPSSQAFTALAGTTVPFGAKGSAKPAAGGQKGAGATVAVRTSRVVSSSELEQLDQRVSTVSILKHTRLLLIDLDCCQPLDTSVTAVQSSAAVVAAQTAGDADEARGETAEAVATRPASPMLVGRAGRLPMVTLRPNTHGYLLTAYTSIPPSAVDTIKDSFLPQRTVTAVAATSSTTDAKPSDADKLRDSTLYGKGLWKLSLRSDKELQLFDTVASQSQVVPVSGYLRRGGASMTCLFRYTITVSEPTHFSLLFSVKESVPIPFNVMIKRCHTTDGNLPRANSPPTLPQGREDTPAADNDGDGRPPQTDEILFAAEGYRVHAFLPDILLSPLLTENRAAVAPSKPDKAGGGNVAVSQFTSSTTYVVEATVPVGAAAEWDELCRETQEGRFHAAQQEAIDRVAARQAAAIAERAEDYDAFIARVTEELECQEAREGLVGSAGQCTSEGNANPRDIAGTQSVSGGVGGASGAGGGASSGSTSRRRRSVDKRRVSTGGSLAQSSFGASAAYRVSRDSTSTPLAADPTAGGGMSAAAPDGSTGFGASTGAPAQSLDSTPEELAVTFHGTFSLSSAKAEVRNAVPTEDLAAQCRALWTNYCFGDPTAAEKADAAGVSAAVTPSSNVVSGAKGSKALLAAAQQQQQQRENEEQQRTNRGRQCRQTFLANPLNILEPHFASPRTADGTFVGGFNREGLSSSRGRSTVAGISGAPNLAAKEAGNNNNSNNNNTNNSNNSARRDHGKVSMALDARDGNGHGARLLVLDDSEENNFGNMAPLSPSQYSVTLLPLRAMEIGAHEPAAVAGGAGAGESQQGHSSAADRSGKGDRDGTHGNTGKRTGLGSAANRSAGNATPSSPAREKDRHTAVGASPAELLRQAETQRLNDALWTLVREPLALHVSAVAGTLHTELERLRECQTHGATLMASYWESRPSSRKETTLPPAALHDTPEVASSQ